MAYIISSVLRKAFENSAQLKKSKNTADDMWKHLMLLPLDYGKDALYHSTTRMLMDKIHFVHGGKKYDSQYPKGIPTSISIQTADGKKYDSGMVLFPGGHSANRTVCLKTILAHKFNCLGQLALSKAELPTFLSNLENIRSLSNSQLRNIYDCNIKFAKQSID